MPFIENLYGNISHPLCFEVVACKNSLINITEPMIKNELIYSKSICSLDICSKITSYQKEKCLRLDVYSNLRLNCFVLKGMMANRGITSVREEIQTVGRLPSRRNNDQGSTTFLKITCPQGK